MRLAGVLASFVDRVIGDANGVCDCRAFHEADDGVAFMVDRTSQKRSFDTRNARRAIVGPLYGSIVTRARVHFPAHA